MKIKFKFLICKTLIVRQISTNLSYSTANRSLNESVGEGIKNHLKKPVGIGLLTEIAPLPYFAWCMKVKR